MQASDELPVVIVVVVEATPRDDCWPNSNLNAKHDRHGVKREGVIKYRKEVLLSLLG